MTTITEKLGFSGGDSTEITIGKSFSNNSASGFHTIRYDFKPASVDTSKVANVDIGEKNQVTVTVPHIQGSGIAQTIFKGSKRPYQKECVLIFDHTTGEVTLERLSSNIQVKKTRSESGYKQPRPLTPTEAANKKQSPPTATASQKPSPKPGTSPVSFPAKPPVASLNNNELVTTENLSDSQSSSSGSSSSSDSSSESENEDESTAVAPSQIPGSMPPPFSQLSEDLQLSESSGSESD